MRPQCDEPADSRDFVLRNDGQSTLDSGQTEPMQASFPGIDRGPFLLSPALRSPLAGTASLDSLPAETRLLLALATAAPDDVRSGQAEAAACEIDDWDRFARIVSDHKVLPLVYPNLKRTCGTRIPDRTMADMKRRMLASAQHNLLLATEMVSLHDHAEAANLAMLAFKGPILTAHAYGDLTRREFGDLDLLVRPSDVDRAATLLTARGYRESTRLNLSWERTFVHDERNIEVDLHWAIAPTEVGPYSAAFRYDLDGLWDRRRSLKILNREVQTFGAEDTLITLCQNSVKDFFRSTWPHLSWFCDLAHVISAEPQMDWRTGRPAVDPIRLPTDRERLHRCNCGAVRLAHRPTRCRYGPTNQPAGERSVRAPSRKPLPSWPARDGSAAAGPNEISLAGPRALAGPARAPGQTPAADSGVPVRAPDFAAGIHIPGQPT